ncbi:arsenate reductase/protein-tyrosine-phosphatase family protein [Solirubrobacter soli]|uniref:arsenate reductase/protein-tyrosine-phosphatase family protein n=1 Tax=Solirubrobacter soli TaxID=363832 RepID=UPI0004814ACF|nr:ArsR family transcriptional regulator [Solirubrobacter soli]
MSPPPFLRLASHPVRWTLLRELGHSDRRVGELCALAGERQSLVSYHLRRLRDGGLVFARRSLADGRDTYYALDVARCGELLAEAGAAMHPALGAGAPSAVTADILFLCTGNSARSQMAEALAGRHAGVRAWSAGSRPKPLHPHAVTVMARRGLDIAAARPKHLDEFADRRFDVVVTLCDRVREVCPEYPRAIHWSLRDPSGGDEAAFESVAEELERRIGFLLATIGSEAIHV